MEAAQDFAEATATQREKRRVTEKRDTVDDDVISFVDTPVSPSSSSRRFVGTDTPYSIFLLLMPPLFFTTVFFFTRAFFPRQYLARTSI